MTRRPCHHGADCAHPFKEDDVTEIKVSQEARAAARCLVDYLSIRGLKDGETERALSRFEAQIVERCAKVAEADNGLMPGGNYAYGPTVRSRIAIAIRTGGQP